MHAYARRQFVPFLWWSLVWPSREANSRPTMREADTLPTEPTRHGQHYLIKQSIWSLLYCTVNHAFPQYDFSYPKRNKVLPRHSYFEEIFLDGFELLWFSFQNINKLVRSVLCTDIHKSYTLNNLKSRDVEQSIQHHQRNHFHDENL